MSKHLSPEERMARKVCVFDQIPHWPDPSKPGKVIAQACSLGVGTVRDIIITIKEDLPKDSLVSSSWGYRWTIDADEVRQYRNRIVQQGYTLMYRLWVGTEKPYVEKVGSPQEIATITMAFDHAFDALRLLLRF